jgi:dipeptidyl aminopeptidase/acylaminoacyl peptidase
MKLLLGLIVIAILGLGLYLTGFQILPIKKVPPVIQEVTHNYNELSIPYLKEQKTPGSEITIEETLDPGSNYSRYIASYQSDGNKIYGLLTVPGGEVPKNGWPLIIFNHGYIPPSEYQTAERYVAYQDGFARSGYVTFKSDYRGHGSSEGTPTGGYGSPGYTIDVLNALASLEKYSSGTKPPVEGLIVDKNRIGMWGHSMGGYITLRAMVVRPEIKAGVIWGGVVASYPDLINDWRKLLPDRVVPSMPASLRSWRQRLVKEYGEPDDKDPFWKTLSANNYLSDISGPLQLQSGEEDEEVPVEFSQKLEKQLKDAGKTTELYIYPGDNHNINGNFDIAEQRSIDWFDKYVKTGY